MNNNFECVIIRQIKCVKGKFVFDENVTVASEDVISYYMVEFIAVR